MACGEPGTCEACHHDIAYHDLIGCWYDNSRDTFCACPVKRTVGCDQCT